MGGLEVLGVGLLLAFPAQAPEPAGSLAYEIYAWLATGGGGAADDRSTSFRVGDDPDAQALAVGTMASLGANLTPNPLAACWVQFPVAGSAAVARPTGTASPVVANVSGPLVLYGGSPGRVHDYPGPDLGPYPNLGFGPRLRGGAGGVPVVSGVTVPSLDAPTDPSLTLNSGRGESNVEGLTVPPGGWTALSLETPLPPGSESPSPPTVVIAPAPDAVRVPIATPEPGTLLLATVGLTALAGVRRTRRGL